MKAIVEFGIRGDRHSSHVCESAKAAAKLAASLAHVFGMDGPNRDKYWTVKRNMPRLGWTSSTHFISVSLLDGVPRGPAYGNAEFVADRRERGAA